MTNKRQEVGRVSRSERRVDESASRRWVIDVADYSLSCWLDCTPGAAYATAHTGQHTARGRTRNQFYRTSLAVAPFANLKTGTHYLQCDIIYHSTESAQSESGEPAEMTGDERCISTPHPHSSGLWAYARPECQRGCRDDQRTGCRPRFAKLRRLSSTAVVVVALSPHLEALVSLSASSDSVQSERAGNQLSASRLASRRPGRSLQEDNAFSRRGGEGLEDVTLHKEGHQVRMNSSGYILQTGTELTGVSILQQQRRS